MCIVQPSFSYYTYILHDCQERFCKNRKTSAMQGGSGKMLLTNQAKSNKIESRRPALRGNPVREAAPKAESAAAESSSSGNTPVCRFCMHNPISPQKKVNRMRGKCAWVKSGGTAGFSYEKHSSRSNLNDRQLGGGFILSGGMIYVPYRNVQ